MKLKVLAKISRRGLELDPAAIRATSTFREIDNLYTAPVHGIRAADDYWIHSSSKLGLSHIKVPTLLIATIHFFQATCCRFRERFRRP